MTPPLWQHLTTVEKLVSLMTAAGWQSWAKNREEQQALAADLIDLREYLISHDGDIKRGRRR